MKLQKDSCILICLSSVKIGGAETQALNLAIGLKNNGFGNVSFLILSNETSGPLLTLLLKHNFRHTTVAFSTYNVDFFKKLPSSFSELKLFFRTRKMINQIKTCLKNINPYVIIPFTYYPSIISIYLKKVTLSKIGIWNQRDVGIEGFNNSIFEKKAISKCDIFIANSIMGRQFLESKSINGNKIRIIKNSFVGKEEIDTKEEWLARLGIAKPANVIVKVSNVIPNKGHLLAIQAFMELRKDIKYADSYLIFAGRIDPRTAEPLQKLIAENSLNERIRFLGYVEDIVGLLKTADLFLFASNSEGSPNAVLEASAYGIPVVSSKLPCVTELVGNDYPYLFETGNVFDAVQKLKNALGNVCKYDFNGLKNSIKNEYSLSNMTGQYLNVIFNNPLARE